MVDLFYRGEALYMSILSLLLFAIIAISIVVSVFLFKDKEINSERAKQYTAYLKPIGLFTLVFGLFVQLLGLYGAFTAIEEWGSVSPEVLSIGLWTSSIPAFYGLLIFLLSRLAHWAFTLWLQRITANT